MLDGHVIVGMQPVAVAIAPDAKHAYVSNLLDATVSVIDITPKWDGKRLRCGRPLSECDSPLLAMLRSFCDHPSVNRG
jgi:hypothetical protein